MTFNAAFKYKLIYIFAIPDNDHEGLLKIGETTVSTDKSLEKLAPNSKELNQAANERIKQYTGTAAVNYSLLHTELAVRSEFDAGKMKYIAFSDNDVHAVLKRSRIKPHDFGEKKGREWFPIDLDTAKNAIKAVKERRLSLQGCEISEGRTPIIFRPEQLKAIKETISRFKSSDHMLWNAKMRFGKTLTALQVAKECGFQKTIIITHRPVVNENWFEDFHKIFYDDPSYKFGSKTKGEKIEKLIEKEDTKFVYFASIQDLRGSEAAGGKFDKNLYEFLTEWDFVIIDEAHEGTQTKHGQAVIDLLNDHKKKPKLLELSGTPFNILSKYTESEVYTWDYVMEQKAKAKWEETHFGDSNPYAGLPKLQIFTYNLNKFLPAYIDAEDSAFNFHEFFRVWTGKPEKDFKPMPENVKVGDFVHEKDVKRFLDLMCKSEKESNYPYSTEEFRNYFRHSLWIVPGVKEAKALSAMLQEHPVFNNFERANVAGDGDEEEKYPDAMAKVRKAIGDDPSKSYSITISCGRLTTGVTVPEWTAVFMLAGTFSTSASSYMQTIFRVQSPANINGKIKENCYVFDFAPDRTLKVVAETARIASRPGENSPKDEVVLGEFLNFCPIISVMGSNMKPYDVPNLMQQLKKAYTDRVVKNGFDDTHIYNENLMRLDEIELKDFEELKKIIGVSKQTKKTEDINVNDQGFTEEEYEKVKQIKKKPKKERTAEELALLEEKKKKQENKQKAISILRGISIRIPLLVYGANISLDEDITVENFAELIDSQSWLEFMPKDVTKSLFKKFTRYYDKDIFVAAGKRIRQLAKAADELPPTERVQKIAALFATFKNPDKETVLTPWRVVNMHLSECLGGYDFFDESREEVLDEPRFVDRGEVTAETLANTKAQILEINSKTGLYPLYVTYSIYRKRCDECKEELTLGKQKELWNLTIKDNVFVICKTEMARSITNRTLCGYNDIKANTYCPDDLINKLKNKSEQFIEKVLKRSTWYKEKGDKKMKFDAIVGNPPYQVMANGEANGSDPIYHLFIDAACKIGEKVSFIHPARFLFNAGKTPKDWNGKMLNDEHYSVVHYWANTADVFPTVDIKGGVATTYWDKQKTFEKIGTFVAFEELRRVLEKVLEKEGFKTLTDVIYPQNKYDFETLYSDYPNYKNIIGSDGADKRLRPNAFDKLDVFTETTKSDDDISIHGLIKNKRVIRYINRKYIEASENLEKYKILVPKANGSGAIGEVLSTPMVGEPMVGYTGSFIGIGSFKTQEEAEACMKYIKTKFTRAMLGTLKVTQDNPRETWQNVPLQDFTEKSDIDWTKSVKEIDQQLYKKYGLSAEEIEFIESKVKEME